MNLSLVKALDDANDPALAHKGVDQTLESFKDLPASTMVIGYAPGRVPEMRYYGRSLSETELRGVLMTLLLRIGNG